VSAAAKLAAMTDAEARHALARCCGATRWADAMMERRPFGDDGALFAAADEVWAAMEKDDVLEAFSHHPRIGADVDKLREKFAPTADWSAGEQSAVAAATEETLLHLRDTNVRYEERHGYIFIVCATGKSAGEMLAILEGRIDNEPEAELAIAAGEQAKITRIRLEKL